LPRPIGEAVWLLTPAREGNDNPMLNEVFKGTQALRVIGDINVKAIAGNCRGKKRSADQPVVGNSQLQKRRKSNRRNKENK